MAIGDRHRLAGRASYADWAATLFAAGLEALLVREKDLGDGELLELCGKVRLAAPKPAFLSVSGRADIAAMAQLDGVHLPANGIPAPAARRVLGPQGLIGRSTHSLDAVRAAFLEGVDYVFFGPVRETASKPGFGAVGFAALAQAAQLGVPVLALGGLEPSDYHAVREAGAHGLAGIGAFLPERLAGVRRLLDGLDAAGAA